VLDSGPAGFAGLQVLCLLPGPGVGRRDALRAAESRIVARASTDAQGAFRFEHPPSVDLQVPLEARELDLCADGRPRRLLRGFAPAAGEPPRTRRESTLTP
jgi:hypothetical protein